MGHMIGMGKAVKADKNELLNKTDKVNVIECPLFLFCREGSSFSMVVLRLLKPSLIR